MRRQRIASLGNATMMARSARKNFCSRKELMLAAVASELRGATTVLVALERYYEKQTKDYLRSPATTYQAWLDHGPREDLEEVRAAIKDPAIWDRLVERYAERRRESRGERE